MTTLPFPDNVPMPDFTAIQLVTVAENDCGWIGNYKNESNSWAVQFFTLFRSCVYLFEALSSRCIDVIYLSGAVFQKVKRKVDLYDACYMVYPQLPRNSAGARRVYTIGFRCKRDAAVWLRWQANATEQYCLTFSNYIARVEAVWKSMEVSGSPSKAMRPGACNFDGGSDDGDAQDQARAKPVPVDLVQAASVPPVPASVASVPGSLPGAQPQHHHLPKPQQDVQPQPRVRKETVPPRPHWLPESGRNTQCNVSPECWLISLRQWREFVDACKATETWAALAAAKGEYKLTMYDINQHFIKPWTQGTGCSVAVLLNGHDPTKADAMLSHAWGGGVMETYQCIVTLAERIGEDTLVFYCCLSMYQPEDGAGLSIEEQVNLKPFRAVIDSKLKHGMFVLHTTLYEVYDRLWVTYELNAACRNGIQVTGLFDTHRWSVEKFWTCLRIDTRAGSCSLQKDRELIDAEIRSTEGGYAMLDATVADIRAEMRDELMALIRQDTTGFRRNSLKSTGSRSSIDPSNELHEVTQFAIEPCCQEPWPLLDCFATDEVAEWIFSALPCSDGEQLLAALFVDEVKGRPVLQARIRIAGVGFLNELRDMVLDRTLEKKLGTTALGGHKLMVRIDRAQFARSYEACVLSLHRLTPHQEEKVKELEQDHEYLHVKATAGAGKTFIAVHRLFDVLLSNPEVRVLFVAQTLSLCYFIVRWVCQRIPHIVQRHEMLRRLHILCEPFADGPQMVQLQQNSITRSPAEKCEYALSIIDEAHHIYSNPGQRLAVEPHVVGATQKLLLSDVSQANGCQVAYPPGAKEIMLMEVIRNSQRIVAAAAAFQLGDNKERVVCHHCAAGPPLKSFLFEPEGPRAQAYAGQTTKALQHVIEYFESLSLHDRLAILVPNDVFLADFKEALQVALQRMECQRTFMLLNAVEAVSLVASQQGEQGECLVVDTVDAFDGLERLFVLAVGLDAPTDDGSVSNRLETRSCLYRALTRAQMMAVVVNEFLPGGWLEFLTTIQLAPETERGDYEMMVSQIDTQAVDAFTSNASAATVRQTEGGKDAPLGNATDIPSSTATDVPSSTATDIPSPACLPLNTALVASEEETKDKATHHVPPASFKTTQSIWDTNGNTLAVWRLKVKFQPFQSSVEDGPCFQWTRIRLLAYGSRGEVYLAQNEDGEFFAAKKLAMGNQRVMDNIASEVDVLSSLDHWHIVKYFGCKWCEMKGIVYIFFQYMARGTLEDYIKHCGILSENTVKTFSTHIIKGVHYLHRKGVVHRDIKSAHVLIDENGVLKLSGFHLSKDLKGRSKSRGCHNMVGSTYWMAPEVCAGEAYGVKADIWSVGCVMLEMLTGKLPWPEFDNLITAMAVIGTCTGPPPTLPTNLPSPLDSFVRSCLVSNPDDHPDADNLLRHPFMNM